MSDANDPHAHPSSGGVRAAPPAEDARRPRLSNVFRTTWGGLRQPKWLFLALASLAFIFSGGIVVASILEGVYDMISLVLASGALGMMALRYGLSSLRHAAFTPGTITVAADGTLSLRTPSCERVLARPGDVRQGFVVPTWEGTVVRLERNGLAIPLFLRVRDEAEGQELLRALGKGAESVAAEMRVASMFLGFPVWKQLALFGGPGALFGWLMADVLTTNPYRVPITSAIATLLVLYMFVLAFAPTRVRIGTDGVLVRWLRRERFHPFGTIASADVYEDQQGNRRHHGVALQLLDGTQVKITTGQTDVGMVDAQRLARRITEARAAMERGASALAGRPRDILLRGSKAVVDWIADLRRIGAGAHDHRRPAVPLDVLLSVVEDTTAAPAERASAAVAAVASADPAARQRVRIAADAVASPKLRASLVRIADVQDATDQELALTLDGLDDVEREAQSRRSRASR